MTDLAQQIRDLEAKGVYMHVGHEHYKDGTNCIWALEFLDENRERKYHTSWYGDNHEFGDTVGCYEAGIRLAKFLLEGDNAYWFFFDVHETVTEQGHKNWLKNRDVNALADEVVYGKEKYNE